MAHASTWYVSWNVNFKVRYGLTAAQLAFWDFDAVFDIISSLVILALPIVIVYPLQMRVDRKIQTISAFGFQIPTCVFAIVRLIYLHRALNAEDHTWEAVQWQIWTAVNLHFNVVAANVPCLKVFIEGTLIVASRIRQR